MKEDGKVGVSDDNKSIFSSLKSRNSSKLPWGMKPGERNVLINRDSLHF